MTKKILLLLAAALLSLAGQLSAQSRLTTTPQIPDGEFVRPVSADATGPDAWHPQAWDRQLPPVDDAQRSAFTRSVENGLAFIQVPAADTAAWGWVSPRVTLDAVLRKGFRVSVAISATADYAGNYPWAFVAWSRSSAYLNRTAFATITPPVTPAGERGIWREFFLDIPASAIPSTATHFTLNLASHRQPGGGAPAGALRYATVTLEPPGGAPPVANGTRIRSPFVKRAVNTPAGTYFTYPHSNGFWRSDPAWDANTIVVGRESEGSNVLSLVEFDPATGNHRAVGASENTNMFYSITRDGRALASTKRGNNSLVLLDLTGRQPDRVLMTAPAGTQISHGADILEDGSKAVFALWNWGAKEFKLQEIDVATGSVTTCMTASWTINHAHYHPFDPGWISLCNEVGNDPIRPMDRIWAWHATLAPQGKRVFDPVDAQGRPIYITHERAMYHKLGVIADVISPSPGEPRGLYEVGYDGTRRVIAEGKGYQHCNISRDGRWAVADVVNQDDRVTMETVLINFKTGKKEILYAGRATKHPWHAHPHISPDGKWVILNDSSLLRAVALEIDPARLEAFLK
ncbi:hypothetical protein OpiT1DRAFT_03477 [Opitutaceae bacterium TAV1]|nr:hypothetical protein OpiT1DRAFT_03477 [Opitutaceae bacterium TAV1]